MPTTLAVVNFSAESGLADDEVVNTFCVQGIGPASDDAHKGALTMALMSFYNAVPAGRPGSLAEVMSLHLARSTGGVALALYDITDHLDGSRHGGYYFIDHGTLAPAAAGSISLPSEAAICLTLESFARSAAAVSAPDGSDVDTRPDRPMERNTGRVYLGPWTTNAIDNVSPYLRPSSVTRQTIVASAQALATGLAANGMNLAVWSRKDALARSVTGVFVDDAWDTQRRRGIAPSGRLTGVMARP